MNRSRIVVTEFRNALGKTERLEYRWEGKSPVVDMSSEYLDDSLFSGNMKIHGKNFHIGPYRLRFIDYVDGSYYATFVRVDYPFWWVVYGWHRVNRWLEIAYRRSIITLAVWDLAYYNQARIPSWYDVKVLRWISDGLKKLKAKS